MLEIFAVVLFLIWAIGMLSSYTFGGFIHILLVISVLVVTLRVIQRRRVR